MYLFLVYSLAFGTFSASPLPGGETEGDGVGCLSCMTGCNGNFFSSFLLFALERELGSGEWRSHPLPPPLSSLLRWLEGGGACLDQMLCPAVVSCFFEAVWLLSATPAAPGAATVCSALLHRTKPSFEDVEQKPSLLDPCHCHRHTHIHRYIHTNAHTHQHPLIQSKSVWASSCYPLICTHALTPTPSALSNKQHQWLYSSYT